MIADGSLTFTLGQALKSKLGKFSKLPIPQLALCFLSDNSYAKEAGPKLLRYFENYFGIPFPLPKQDMVAIPDFSAGGC